MSAWMYRCTGCGFHAEDYDVVADIDHERHKCSKCKLCEREPRLRESYRRGYNAGLEHGCHAMVDYARSFEAEFKRTMP